jgi:hypothetical protein
VSVLISIPTLYRPERVIETARSARENTPGASILISVSPGDQATIDALADLDEFAFDIVGWPHTRGADWARKHNAAYAEMDEEWILLAGDDLHFHEGWFEACLAAASRHPGGACVVGTNDMGNSRVLAGHHSTHPLVHRDYISCGGVPDDPEKLLPECYGHWFVDDEFVRTAMARRTYAHAHGALVEHMHPNWGKADDDETYRIGQESIPRDHALFQRRVSLWDPHRSQGGPPRARR